jgi:hypothetical protein
VSAARRVVGLLAALAGRALLVGLALGLVLGLMVVALDAIEADGLDSRDAQRAQRAPAAGGPPAPLETRAPRAADRPRIFWKFSEVIG